MGKSTANCELLKLNGPDTEPLHRRFRKRILELIDNGNLKVDDMLPSRNQIRKTVGISSTPYHKAVNELILEGILTAEQGKGVFGPLATAPDRSRTNDYLAGFGPRYSGTYCFYRSYQWCAERDRSRGLQFEIHLFPSGQFSAGIGRKTQNAILPRRYRPVFQQSNSQDFARSAGFRHSGSTAGVFPS